jgi:CelD/BcsL family acetyltransferase involved in cellulose biosynthesis
LNWHLLNLATESDRNEALALSKLALNSSRLGARAFDMTWRSGSINDPSSLRVFVLRREATPVGLAVFSVHSKALALRLGEISIANVSLIRHWHLGDPYLDVTLDSAAATDACRALVSAATSQLGRRECLFFEGLPVEGPMRDAIAGSKSNTATLRLDLGDDFEHQFIRMPNSFADYLEQLGSRSRQSLLYSRRRLAKDMGDDVRCECFESEQSIERFVVDATAVSRKTYQWNLLGLGLRDPEALSNTLRLAARNGWLRSFILYCRQAPVAFMLGSQHGDCYYYDDVGYDPDFSKWSVGSVLQLLVLEQLLGRPDKPTTFDFSTGYGEHKGRFGNFSRRECNLLVLPRTFANVALGHAYRGTDRLSRSAARILANAGLKDRLKRLIRRGSARNVTPG